MYADYTFRLRKSKAATMKGAIVLAVNESGQEKALEFSTVWSVFAMHLTQASREASVCIVVDALDECRDPRVLIEQLQHISHLDHISVILTSRREAALCSMLQGSSSIEMTPEDVDADIEAYVESKIVGTQLADPAVRSSVVNRLCGLHGGMFLWVHLILEELRYCLTISAVHKELQELPEGMRGLYKKILGRLQSTLKKGTLQLCKKVLTWVTTATVCLFKTRVRCRRANT